MIPECTLCESCNFCKTTAISVDLALVIKLLCSQANV